MNRNMAKGMLAAAAMLALAGCKSDEDTAREFLATALQQYAIVQDTAAPTADRLAAGHEVVAVLDRIVAEYATTDLGLQIAAGGGFGDVSRAELTTQIADLEKVRETELCDVQPTPGCIVERLALDLGIRDRPSLYMRADGAESGIALWMAMASRDTGAAQNLVYTSGRGAVPALGLAMAPLAALDDRTVGMALDAFDERTKAIAAFIALHRIALGEDHESLRAIVAGYRAIPDLLTLIDPALPLDQKIAWVDRMEDARTLPVREIREAGNVLMLLNRTNTEELLLDILLQQHDADDFGAIFGNTDPDFDNLHQVFGPDVALSRAAQALRDPATTPRTYSLALMYAALYMPVDDLRSAVAALAGQEVMTWDNIRVFSPLIALGYIGDRALFDAAMQILTPANIRDQLERTWTAGRALAEGSFDANSDVLSDAGLFMATLSAASARTTREHLETFLTAAAEVAGERPRSEIRGPIGGVDIAQAAVNCGLPAVLAQLPDSVTEARLRLAYCDRQRLGTTADLWSEAEFAAFLETGLGDGPIGRALIVETAHAAPVRAHAFVQTGQGNERLFETALLAMLLASPPARD